MRAIALRLEGPLQSWGGSALGEVRPTHDAPTASGVIGMVGAALGLERREGVDALAALHRGLALAVRVERRGTILVDYHTAMDVPTGPRSFHKGADITRRRYLADASFAAVLVGVDESALGVMSLERLVAALRRPRFSLSLGRRACAPSAPVLARRDVIEGPDWRALLDLVPVTREGRVDRDAGEVWVDGRLVPDAEHGAVGQRWRDRVVGPLPRMFGDRKVLRLSGALPPVGPARAAAIEDTTQGFLP